MGLPDDLKVHLVDSVDEAYEMMRWLGERRGVLAFDLETTGLDARADGAAIRLAQLGDENHGWAIPWERWSGVFLEALSRYDGQLTGHNVSFDNRWLEIHADWQVPWHRLHDTMIMSQIVEPGARGHGLKDLGDRHIDRRASAGQYRLKAAMKAQKWGWDTVPVDFPMYWQYGCIDTVLTAHLWHKLRADLAYPRAYETEMAARRICSKIEDNGMPIDLDYCEQAMGKLEEQVATAKGWAQENWGVNIGSSPQLIKFFTEQLGQEITITTPSGNPSMDKNQLELFAGSDHALTSQAAGFILGTRKAEKLATTYFKNFLTKNKDGWLHPSIKTMGARTGRMSVVNPALQTLSKKDPFVRDAFVPRPGEVLISSDYSQIEMRLLAHFSNDPALIKAFLEADRTGDDFFRMMGAEVYAEPGFKKSDKRRGDIKGVLYGAAYGAGVPTMARTAGVPEEQMRAAANAVFGTYPGIKGFQRAIDDVGVRREKEEGMGYVVTPDGRRITTDEGFVYKLTNYLLQGTAAYLLKEALIRLDNAGFGPSMLIPIHDEVVFSLPESDLPEAMPAIQEAMSVMEGFAVPMPAEPEGPFDRWGTKYR